ncbi:MAG: lipopolysaccharide biosynthesis protein [Thermoplasmata archaeon]|nr:lipopolysaccharide biosynthesis protein [Thermoplasmata archaeon]
MSEMPAEERTLKEATIRSAGIVYAMVAFTKLLNLIALVILARILIPRDFGLVTIAAIIIGIITLFKDFGLGAAYIQRRTDEDEAADIVFWSNIALRLVLYAIAFVVAPFGADFFGEPLVEPIIRVASLSFVIEAFASVHGARLTKTMQFRKIAIITVITSSVNTVSTVAFALAGFSYWSLVLGGLVGGPVNVALYWKMHRWRPRIRFNRVVARDMYTYGRDIVGINLMGFGVRNIDNFAIGKFVGSTGLGVYTLARRFGLYSGQNIVALLGRVLFPAYSKIQMQKEKLKRAYTKTFYPVSMLSFPVAIGLAILSYEFVFYILGPNWSQVEIPLQFLAFYGLFYSLSAVGSNVFLAVKRQDVPLKILAAELLVLLAGLYPVTTIYGLVGATIFVTLTIAVGSTASVIIVNRLLEVRVRDVARMVGVPLASSLVMGLGLVLVKIALPLSILTFAIELIVGSLIYLGVLHCLSRGELLSFTREIWSALRPKKDSEK